MKYVKMMLFALYLLALIVFMVMNQMTPDPGTTSGNGNPALMIAWVLFPMLIMLVMGWIRFFRGKSISSSVTILSIAGILLHLTIGLIYRQHRLNEYREVIKNALIQREGVATEEYLQAITSGLSFHINNVNFSINTYLMFGSFSILLALVYTLWDAWETKNDNRQR